MSKGFVHTLEEELRRRTKLARGIINNGYGYAALSYIIFVVSHVERLRCGDYDGEEGLKTGRSSPPHGQGKATRLNWRAAVEYDTRKFKYGVNLPVFSDY